MEDWELNLRIRRAGYRVWFDPTLSVVYWPRESWTALVRQFRATGAWRGELVRRYGRGNSLRYFAPPALLAASGISIVTAVAQIARRRGGPASLLHLPVAAYAALIAVVALAGAEGAGGATRRGPLPCCPRCTCRGARASSGRCSAARATRSTPRACAGGTRRCRSPRSLSLSMGPGPRATQVPEPVEGTGTPRNTGP